jgi:3-oxoacyl-[acyl-carrier-protein] synthase-3
MGIKIYKPVTYLGNKEVFLKNILKNKLYDLKNKIGSERIHIETRKNILEMAVNVSKKCINLYKINPKLLILVSQGQDKKLPSCAEEVAHKCQIDHTRLVFTISSGCSGFVQSIYLANKLLSKEMNQGLIVCAEKYSNYIQNSDLKTKLLFSDAASATFVKYSKDTNILNGYFGFDGKESDSLQITKDKNSKEILSMNGNKVFLFSIKNVPKILKKILKKNKSIKHYFIHPGSKILLDSIIKKTHIDYSKVPTSFHITGNTVSTSIPLLLKNNYNLIKKKDIILMSGFGVGLSHATILMKWI